RNDTGSAPLRECMRKTMNQYLQYFLNEKGAVQRFAVQHRSVVLRILISMLDDGAPMSAKFEGIEDHPSAVHSRYVRLSVSVPARATNRTTREKKSTTKTIQPNNANCGALCTTAMQFLSPTCYRIR